MGEHRDQSNVELHAGDVVLVEYAETEPARAEVTDPRPYSDRDVVKVKYLHSNTGAYVARRRILGLAP